MKLTKISKKKSESMNQSSTVQTVDSSLTNDIRRGSTVAVYNMSLTHTGHEQGSGKMYRIMMISHFSLNPSSGNMIHLSFLSFGSSRSLI